jgi:hypothetical protein
MMRVNACAIVEIDAEPWFPRSAPHNSGIG